MLFFSGLYSIKEIYNYTDCVRNVLYSIEYVVSIELMNGRNKSDAVIYLVTGSSSLWMPAHVIILNNDNTETLQLRKSERYEEKGSGQ